MRASAEQISIVPLEQLRDFTNHPYHVNKDASFEELKNSIRVNGILSPLLIRPVKSEEVFEVISGHRRKAAANALNMKEVPAIIRIMDDNSAIVAMVDSNQQRENLLPSEKAKAYKMKLDALKRQGRRNDLTSCQVGTMSRSDAEIAQNAADSARTIHRYICLTNLIPDILAMVDTKTLAFNTAVELSYLSEEDQSLLYKTVLVKGTMPSMAQAARLKEVSRSCGLTTDEINAAISKESAVAKSNDAFAVLRPYFPDASSTEDILNRIIQLLSKEKLG